MHNCLYSKKSPRLKRGDELLQGELAFRSDGLDRQAVVTGIPGEAEVRVVRAPEPENEQQRQLSQKPLLHSTFS